MEDKSKRRNFLKCLFSLSAFIAGSNLSFNMAKGLKRGKSSVPDAWGKEGVNKNVKKIAVEEHAIKEDLEQLDKRLKDMDEAGIEMQVFSYDVGDTEGFSRSEDLATAKSANETLSRIVEKYPDRFACYCTLPMRNPDAAPEELERAVKQLGLKGPLIYSGRTTSGYLDEQQYWGIFETAIKLNVPVYLHPGAVLPDMSKPYCTYPVLRGAMWGAAAATSLNAMRMIVGGVFERYPELKIILGHMGEGIPYWLWRIDKHYVQGQVMTEEGDPGGNLTKKPSEYFLSNFYVTTSGMCWQPVLQFVLSVMGADKILFACDYPPEPALDASKFIDAASMSVGDKEKICHLNAERLFRL